MKYLSRMLTATFEPAEDSSLEDCVRDAINFSKMNGGHEFSDEFGPLVTFEFNGLQITVRSDSEPEDVYLAYQRALIDIVVIKPTADPDQAGATQEHHGLLAATIAEMNHRMYDS